MQLRTDFCDELIDEQFSDHRIDYHKKSYENGVITSIKIKEDENPLEKEKGDYITISINNIDDYDQRYIVKETLTYELNKILNIFSKHIQKVLVVGLGNQSVVCDALGPKVIEQILVTSHLIKEELIDANIYSDVSALAFGVMGQTGIESYDLIKSSVDLIKPDLILVVDALMTSSMSRLNKVIQMNNIGIKPGAGIGNHRKHLDEKNLGVPIISIGVATVTSVFAICKEKQVDIQLEEDENLIVTLKSMDKELIYLSEIIAEAINQAIHKNYEHL